MARTKARQKWQKGLDPMEIPSEAKLAAAEEELKEGSYDGSDIEYIAGTNRRNPAYGGHSDEATALAGEPLYRLAAIRLLAKEGHFSVDALRMYAWTGFQELLLPRNPLFAFVRQGTNPPHWLLDRPALLQWLREASDEDLLAVNKWHSWTVETYDPELHKLWIETLVELGLERLQYILRLASTPEVIKAKREGPNYVGRLTKAIAQCVMSTLEVSQDGTVTSAGFFKTKLGEGFEDGSGA